MWMMWMWMTSQNRYHLLTQKWWVKPYLLSAQNCLQAYKHHFHLYSPKHFLQICLPSQTPNFKWIGNPKVWTLVEQIKCHTYYLNWHIIYVKSSMYLAQKKKIVIQIIKQFWFHSKFSLEDVDLNAISHGSTSENPKIAQTKWAMFPLFQGD